MTKLKTYTAHSNTHVGTSGFTNHFPGSSAKLAASLERVFAEHPGAVVLNGADDWYASESRRPVSIVRKLGIEPLAHFHNGISGIAKSGVVITAEDLATIEAAFPAQEWTQIRKPSKTGLNLRDCVKVYEDPGKGMATAS